MDLAKSLDVADFYVPISRDDMIATPQWAQILVDHPRGFDIGRRDFFALQKFRIPAD